MMTVRDSVEGARRTIPRDQWQFTDDGKSVRMAAGFEPQKIYEVVYRAQDPPWSASGRRPFATRSRRSSMQRRRELGLAPGAIKRAHRLRHLAERPLSPHLSLLRLQRRRVAPQGVRRRDAARRGQRARQLQPPLRAAVARRASLHQLLLPDRHLPVHRRRADRSGDRRHRWPADARDQARVSAEHLLHQLLVRILGPRRVAVSTPPSTARRTRGCRPTCAATCSRPGSMAWPAFPPTRSIGQQMNNPLDYRWAMRSLLVSMNRWVTDGTAPPAERAAARRQRHARDAGQVEVPEAARRERARGAAQGLSRRLRPGLHHERASSRRSRRRSGRRSRFWCRRWTPTATSWPASACRNWRCRSRPTPAGISSTRSRARPTWSRACRDRSSRWRARSADRERSNDPRRSIEERYRGRDQYLAEITKAANDLVAKGYVAKADMPRIVEQAGTRWDYVMKAVVETQEPK